MQTMRTSQGVALAVIDDWVMHDYGSVETTLKRAFSNSGLLELTVYDMNGRVISSVMRDPRQDVVKVHFNRDLYPNFSGN